MNTLSGKVALVTGAGTGIGRAIAEAFADAGAQVVIAARREAPLQTVCASAPAAISHAVMDLTSAADRRRTIDTVIARHGRLDILVNNAACQLWKPFLETSDAEIESLYLTNLTAMTLLIKMAVPHLQQHGGNIVNISSTAGRYIGMPSENLSVYGASKAALNQLTRTLAPELGPLGVRINAVAPGVTAAEYALQEIDANAGLRDALISRTPLGRIGGPEDIARSVLFLASDQAGWVTGQVLDASGGWQIAAG